MKTVLRRFLSAAVLLTLLAAAAVVWLWNGPGAAGEGPLLPFVISRAPGGGWPVLPQQSSPLWLAVDFGASNTVSSHRTSRAVAAARGARLARRSVLVLAESDDELSAAVALRIIRDLQQDASIEQLMYLPAAHELVGVSRPDLVVRLAAPRQEDATRVGRGVASAELAVRVASAALADGPSITTRDDGNPRLVTFSVEIDASTRIERDGLATRSAVLAGLADGLAGPVAAAVRDVCDELVAEYGAVPALPRTFVPEFVPAAAEVLDVAAIAPPDGVVTRLASFTASFVDNETWWRVDAPRFGDAERRQFAAAIAAAGYEPIGGEELAPSAFVRGDYELSWFASARTGPSSVGSATAAAVYVRLRHRVDDSSRQRVLAAVAADPATSAELLAFVLPCLRGEAGERAMERFDALELLDSRLLLLRSELRRDAGDDVGAAADLVAARWLADASLDGDEMLRKVRARAQDFAVDLDAGLEPARLRALGFQRLEPHAGPVEGRIDANGRVLRCYAYSPDGLPVRIVVGLRPVDGGRSVAVFRTVGANTSTSSGVGRGAHYADTVAGRVKIVLADMPEDGESLVRASMEPR